MKKLNKLVMAICKVGEIFLFICDIALLIAVIFTCFVKTEVINEAFNNQKLTTTLTNVSNIKNIKIVLILALILGLIVLTNATMILRNIHLIFKTTQGKTRFSKGETPFQKDNVRMIREISIFIMSIVLFEFIGSTFINMIAQTTLFKINLDLGKIFFALVVLCLSQYFSYGVLLEEEVEGLV